MKCDSSIPPGGTWHEGGGVYIIPRACKPEKETQRARYNQRRIILNLNVTPWGKPGKQIINRVLIFKLCHTKQEAGKDYTDGNPNPRVTGHGWRTANLKQTCILPPDGRGRAWPGSRGTPFVRTARVEG